MRASDEQAPGERARVALAGLVPPLRSSLSASLAADCEVFPLESGEDARSLLGGPALDLAVVGPPGPVAGTLVEELRERAEACPVLFLAAGWEAQGGARAGIDGVLSPPFEPGQATEVVHSMLLQRARRRQAELEAALAVRDEALSILAHDLKSPLSALALGLDAAATLARRGAPVADRLDRARLQLGGVVESLDDLARAARAAPGPGAAVLGDVDLRPLAREVARRCGPALEELGVSLELELSAELTGCWDGRLLERALVNLVGAAAQRAKGTLVLSVSGEGGARVTLRDAGTEPGGLAREVARLVAGGEAATARAHGPGAWIAQRLLRAVGGRLYLSPAGAPPLFVVALPGAPSSPGQ